MSTSDAGGPLDERWRADRMTVQEAAVPAGSAVVSCPAPYGGGGLGRHLQEIVQALERREQAPQVVCESADEPAGRRPGAGELARLLRPVGRFSPAWRMWAASVRFDSAAAERPLRPADHLIAFNGTALAQFRAAQSTGASPWLVSANSHMQNVIRQHELAHSEYPIERPWATHLLRRNLAEYRRAEGIYVSSSYVRESLVEHGLAQETLHLFPLTPHPRFKPAPRPAPANTFNVVYSGSLTVHKGVPLLVDAFGRLPHDDLRLVLVGGWKTRSMRRFIERACAADSRIQAGPGDPLPHLRAARLCAHPAYEDGFAYAPAEALAAGVPVIVSEDTGMKELIDSDRHGLVLPTGDPDALAQGIQAAYRGEVLGG
ncbi:MAG TPA: glycosyltransferase family 4 protein [Solirubrobacteraceae bacterium]|nr:glycosyltransferase family 4 protein [Solirubrobacteraceae bacterium]